VGAITDDTQMTLFTAEGLIRGHNRHQDRGIGALDVVVWRSYLRWLETQGERSHELDHSGRDGWLYSIPELRHQRAPGTTCLEALRSGRMGTMRRRLNQSKGCGGVMRAAPVALAFADPFRDACRFAAITHGHPTGYLAAGTFAVVLRGCLEGQPLQAAIRRALEELKRHRQHRECLAAVKEALELAAQAKPTPETVEKLGKGWIAEEALAIALFCALTARDFKSGVLTAVNHSGDSDSTGSMTGNILGAIHGVSAIPRNWLRHLELREVIETVAEDMFIHLAGPPPRPRIDVGRYPTW
jgi:ADP-ribosylglycohydrolase